MQTETVLEPIDPGKTKGKTLFFPTIQPEDVLQHNFEEQEYEPKSELESEPEREPAPKPRRTKAAPAKKQEKPKPKKKKKKRKSAWKRWQEAREEKRRNAPPKTPEQLKRIDTDALNQVLDGLPTLMLFPCIYHRRCSFDTIRMLRWGEGARFGMVTVPNPDDTVRQYMKEIRRVIQAKQHQLFGLLT